jgi:hypothetical protein
MSYKNASAAPILEGTPNKAQRDFMLMRHF